MAIKTFGCGRPECGASTTINEDISFGTGFLDNDGFWEEGCYTCARAWEKIHHHDRAWPYFMTMSDSSLKKLREAFAFGLEDLLTDPKLSLSLVQKWTDAELKFPEIIRNGGRIPGTCRLIQDRFARVLSESCLRREYYYRAREEIFSSWRSWK
jgi:hypothetical protein